MWFLFVKFQVYQAFLKQANYLTYLVNCQDLWDQADAQVAKGGHTGEKKSFW